MTIRAPSTPNHALPNLSYSIGAALCALLSTSPAFAANIFDPESRGAAPVDTFAASSAGSTLQVQSQTKLKLGLDTLNREYQAFQAGVAQGRASAGTFATQRTTARIEDNRVAIDAVASKDPALLRKALERLGANILGGAGLMLSAEVPLTKISALENVQALQFARLAWPTTRTGSVTSQGDPAQRSDLARQDFGVDGSGSTVGVLSDSFDCVRTGTTYAADVLSGDLPPDVLVLSDLRWRCTDEGRAMAQIVYDVAPGVGLAFHTAFKGEADFAQGILDLANAGADIIVDDVMYFDEPMFQDGVIAQAIDQVNAMGVPYFSAAGNSGRDAYQAAFVDSGLIGPLGGALHDFDPGPGVDTRLALAQNADTTYVLQWQDPFFSVSGPPGATTDLNLCIYTPPGALTPVGCSQDVNIGGDPVEGLTLVGARDLEISVEKSSGPDPDPIKLVMFGDTTPVDTYDGIGAGTIYGHTNAAGANAVGASAYFLTPEFGEIPPVLNYYSSAGNTPILFDTAGNPISETREKPEFTAPDGGNNTFFGSDFEPDGWPNFFGTSAAAPHAAGVAALMREVDPTLTPSEVTGLLQGTAVDILERETLGFFGPRVSLASGYDNDSGSGLIDALAALQSISAPATAADLSITKTDSPDPVAVGAQLTYTITVTNLGPSTATGVTMTDNLPLRTSFLSVSTTQGTCSGTTTVVCNLSSLSAGSKAVVEIVVQPKRVGWVRNQASVAAVEPDPDTVSNNASATTRVVAAQ